MADDAGHDEELRADPRVVGFVVDGRRRGDAVAAQEFLRARLAQQVVLGEDAPAGRWNSHHVLVDGAIGPLRRELQAFARPTGSAVGRFELGEHHRLAELLLEPVA